MAVIAAQQIGSERVLGSNPFGKKLVQRDYRHPVTGKMYEFSIFIFKDGKVLPSIFMPITADGKNVIAVRQFREGANSLILEFPGGNPKGSQTPEDVVRDELLEETGYKAGTIINLAPRHPIWIEPSSFSTPMHPFLVTGCMKVGEQSLDPTENMEVETYPLPTWTKMCMNGEIVCGKTLAITFLALPHLNIQLTS